MFKTIALRALRGFVAGALGALVPLVTITVVIKDLKSFEIWLMELAFSAIAGGIAGSILAFDKLRRWKDPDGTATDAPVK